MFFNVYTCFQISQTHQIPFTCNQIASYLASPDALTFQCQTLHLPATKLLLTLQRKAMHLPCNAKHCTYLQQSCHIPRSAKRCTYLPMRSIALTCNKVASYLAAQSDALTCNAPRCHTLQKPPPQSCPSHISTYHSPCVQPPVR